jgi:hypothetical protein
MQGSQAQLGSNLTLQTQVDALNEKATQMQKAITEMQTRTKQVYFFPLNIFQ